jgi:AcrR family transcriptional regulator
MAGWDPTGYFMPSKEKEERTPPSKKKSIRNGKLPKVLSEKAQQTRDRLLSTAIRMFADQGYEGVSVDRLVEVAKVNKRMVYHYFGSKQGLYGAVLETAYLRLGEIEAISFRDDPPAAEAIARLVRGYFGFLQSHTDLIRVILWENLQGGRHLATLGHHLTKAPILEELERVIEAGKASGEIRREINGRHLLVNLIGLCLVYFSNRHTLSLALGMDLHSPGHLEQGIRHAIDLAQKGFLTQGEIHGK